MANRRIQIQLLIATSLILAACSPQDGAEQSSGDATAPQAERAQLPNREPGANRILTQPLSTAEGVEAIVEDAIFPPNAALPAHYHPGEEVLYMIEGRVDLFERGREPLTLKAGDAHVIAAGLVHHAMAGPNGARAVIFRAHIAGQPVRIEAPKEGDGE